MQPSHGLLSSTRMKHAEESRPQNQASQPPSTRTPEASPSAISDRSIAAMTSIDDLLLHFRPAAGSFLAPPLRPPCPRRPHQSARAAPVALLGKITHSSIKEQSKLNLVFISCPCDGVFIEILNFIILIQKTKIPPQLD